MQPMQQVAARDVFFLAGLGLFLGLLQRPVDRLEVGQHELGVDDADVAQRVDRTGDMRDVVVFKTAHDMGDRMGLADVGQELVAEALALRRAGDEPGDIDEFHRRRDDFLRIHDGRQLSEPWIRHRDDPHVRVDRAKWIVLGSDFRCRECIKESRFADVRQTHDSASNSHKGGDFIEKRGA